jgi:hypothetical protein
MDLSAAADGSRAGVLIVEAVAYNHDGLVVNSSQDAFRYQLNPQQWEQAMAKGLQLHQQIDVPAGDLFLRMGICDLVSGHIGTVEIPLQVSAATKNTKSVDDAR